MFCDSAESLREAMVFCVATEDRPGLWARLSDSAHVRASDFP